MTTGRRRGDGPRSRAPGGSAGPGGAGTRVSPPREHEPVTGRRLHAVPGHAPPPAHPADDPPTTPVAQPVDPAPVTLAAEDEVLAAARARAAERGVGAVEPATAAVWSFVAAATGARAAVELGTGVGVGSVALLRGMPADATLTSVDTDAETQRLARTACTEAGFSAGRLRLITGRPLDVLPRLADAGYDLVVLGADRTAPADRPTLLTAALRLLRPGGVVAIDRVRGPAGTDPVRRDAATAAQREILRLIRTDERLTSLVLPFGDGVLCAALRR